MDFIGKRYGKLEVFEKCKPPPHSCKTHLRCSWYICKCDCGNTCFRSYPKLKDYERLQVKKVNCGCTKITNEGCGRKLNPRKVYYNPDFKYLRR